MTLSQNEEGDGTNYAATSGTIGRSGLPSFPGAGDMMTEMASKLRERRIKADGGTQVSVLSVLSSVLSYSVCGSAVLRESLFSLICVDISCYCYTCFASQYGDHSFSVIVPVLIKNCSAKSTV